METMNVRFVCGFQLSDYEGPLLHALGEVAYFNMYARNSSMTRKMRWKESIY